MAEVNTHRRFTVRDSVEMARFTSGSLTGNPDPLIAPDTKHFVALTSRGNLDTNQIESTIWLFDSRTIERYLHTNGGRPPRPKALVTLRTSSNSEPISSVRWDQDSRSVVFLGRRGGSARHLFVVDVNSGVLQELSPPDLDVVDFDRTEGETAFTTMPVIEEGGLYQSGGPSLPDDERGTGQSLFDLLYPAWAVSNPAFKSQAVWFVRGGKTMPVLLSNSKRQISIAAPSYEQILVLSPDGRYLITTNFVRHVPLEWESYQPADPSSYMKIIADKPGVPRLVHDISRPVQFVLIDLRGGTIQPLLDAPTALRSGYADALQALWSSEGRTAIVSNTFLPLTTTEQERRPCVTSVEIATGKSECVKKLALLDRGNPNAPPRLTNMGWDSTGKKLVLQFGSSHSKNSQSEVFERQNGTWRQVILQAGQQKVQPSRLRVTLRQGVNEPPVLVASSLAQEPEKKIFDPNPQLSRIELGEASVYRWKDNFGHEWTGGLIKPPGYITGHRYPLVIQTHGFNEQQFLIDGPAATAMAARAIAARGIVVLQVREIRTKEFGTPEEPEVDGRVGYRSAIEQLDAEGLIDPSKVGIIGWSHSGWYVLDALLHTPHQFAAATLAESTYASMGEYLLNADLRTTQRADALAELIGSHPFGAGLRTWIQRSAGFNTDKIETPIMFQADSPPALIYAWDIYAALRLQRKPVDLLYFRNGGHVLVKPRERLISQQETVDWYDFWLNNYEDTDPAKAAQYKQWGTLRERQQEEVTKGGNAIQR